MNAMTESERYIMKRKRLRIAREILAEGGSLKDFAERIGISTTGVIKYLDLHSPSTRRALADNHRGNSMHPIRVLERLRIIHASRSLRHAASKIGINHSAVFTFVKRYAPDGIEDALADYEEAYGVPLFEGRDAA